MAETMQAVTGPMGQTVPIPQMDDLDWNVLEFLEGRNTFGKDWKHPNFHFGVLNKFASDTGTKLKSKYYDTISEEEYESYERDYGIRLSPVDDPVVDGEGRLHYKELIWFKMPMNVWRSMEKLNLLKANGQDPRAAGTMANSQRQADAWRQSMLARSQGKFGERDIQVNAVEKSSTDRLVTSVSETENRVASDVEKMHPVEASGPSELIL